MAHAYAVPMGPPVDGDETTLAKSYGKGGRDVFCSHECAGDPGRGTVPIDDARPGEKCVGCGRPVDAAFDVAVCNGAPSADVVRALREVFGIDVASASAMADRGRRSHSTPYGVAARDAASLNRVAPWFKVVPGGA